MILISLTCNRIPPSPDNFKRVVKYQTFQMPFNSSYESVANIIFLFEINFEMRSIQSYQTVAVIKGS